ncbi:MAG: UDP-N-acetylmuramoyl-tripeptide--D-alanyl-D-alanine ligase [Fusobacterium sp.]|nr:UDP-N-acetylmuramoyl-tripeptide--D-alanyl-D-alanine ligase [Fusobacterium sp.]
MKKLVEIITKILPIKTKILNIGNVQMDSRKIEKDDVFFALNSGKNYIPQVLEKGASLVVCDDKKWEGHEKVAVVEDTLKTMQEIAKEYRKSLPIKIIGVVGSNGKTTTKDIVYSVLSSRYKCIKTEGNYNNHIGVPYTLLQIKEDDEFAVVEMGMSSRGEIKFLCETVLPDYGIITNIGDSHLEFLLNRENVFIEKSEIKNYVDKDSLIIFGDDFYLKNLNGIKVGFEKNNNFIIENYKETSEGVSFEIEKEKYNFHMNGKHNCINAAFGAVVGKTAGLSYEEIERGLKNCKVTPMRFQKVEKNGIKYINDSYNASPVSMKYSLETLADAYKRISKIAVLADMGELGKDELKYHIEVLEYAVTLDIEKIIVFGNIMKEAAEKIENREKLIVAETKEEIKNIIRKDFADRVVLIKGSNFNHLWEIME